MATLVFLRYWKLWICILVFSDFKVPQMKAQLQLDVDDRADAPGLGIRTVAKAIRCGYKKSCNILSVTLLVFLNLTMFSFISSTPWRCTSTRVGCCFGTSGRPTTRSSSGFWRSWTLPTNPDLWYFCLRENYWLINSRTVWVALRILRTLLASISSFKTA